MTWLQRVGVVAVVVLAGAAMRSGWAQPAAPAEPLLTNCLV